MKLDRQIALHRPEYVRDSTGQSVVQYVFDRVVSAGKGAQGRAKLAQGRALGSEGVTAGQVMSVSTDQFTVRYDAAPDVTTAWQVRYRDVAYNIQSIDEVGRSDFLVITARQVDGSAS